MDLLKDITRELRGGENESSSADGGQSKTTPTARADSGHRDAPDGAADRSGTLDESTGNVPSADQNSESPDQRGEASGEAGRSAGRAGGSAGQAGESPGQAGESAGESAKSPDQSAEDVHVCSFCETEFDASDSVCPGCDAEIVLRGER